MTDDRARDGRPNDATPPPIADTPPRHDAIAEAGMRKYFNPALANARRHLRPMTSEPTAANRAAPLRGQHEPRVRNIAALVDDDNDTVVRVDYVEASDPAQDGEALVGLAVCKDGAWVNVLIGAEETLMLANRLTCAANLTMVPLFQQKKG
jgi:hypothetical protein